MFGVPDEQLIESLEAIRLQLCAYRAGPDESCDCKYGASFTGEQTGCPELRQAIKVLQGKHAEILVMERLNEQRATRALTEIAAVLRRVRQR